MPLILFYNLKKLSLQFRRTMGDKLKGSKLDAKKR